MSGTRASEGFHGHEPLHNKKTSSPSRDGYWFVRGFALHAALPCPSEALDFLNPTWTPTVCRIMACMAILGGLGLLFYIVLGLG